MTKTSTKPGRPFGVILAILLSVLFFSVIPGLTVLSRIMIEEHITREQVITLQDGSQVTVTSGIDEDSALGQTRLQIQLAISIGFIVVAIFAWRGRPAWMRYLFMLTVLGIAGILLFQSFTLFRENNLTGGTGEAFFQFLQNTNILFLILVPVYVVWYLNRAPARAFYRGYYLQEEIDNLEEAQQAPD